MRYAVSILSFALFVPAVRADEKTFDSNGTKPRPITSWETCSGATGARPSGTGRSSAWPTPQ